MQPFATIWFVRFDNGTPEGYTAWLTGSLRVADFISLLNDHGIRVIEKKSVGIEYKQTWMCRFLENLELTPDQLEASQTPFPRN
jgi:hypothetical protein